MRQASDRLGLQRLSLSNRLWQTHDEDTKNQEHERRPRGPRKRQRSPMKMSITPTPACPYLLRHRPQCGVPNLPRSAHGSNS